MAKPKIYLAGPIAGLTYGDANEWRLQVAEALGGYVECYSPLRSKAPLLPDGPLGTGGYDTHPLTTSYGILTRDHWDCMTSDLIFVNLLGTKEVSKGTVMEIAWGHAYRKPIVCCIESVGNVHEHGMLMECISYRTDQLIEAIEITRAFLLPQDVYHVGR